MTPGNLQARRATLDDLSELRLLWNEAGLDGAQLERRLTDFQVVEAVDGGLRGALALRVIGPQGVLHSETLAPGGSGDETRRSLWGRAQAVARNHGLHRIWTQENSLFWRDLGFTTPSADLSAKPPVEFATSAGAWTVLKLRDEAAAGISLEQELEIFALAQKENHERTVRQVTLIKNLAYAVLFLALIIGAVLIGLAVLPSSSWSKFFKPAPTLPSAPATTNVLTK